MADIAASVLAKLKNKAKVSGISYQDAICQGAFLQKLQIVQQNLHEGYRGAH